MKRVCVASLAALIGGAWVQFQHACSYVGTEGVARFICAGHRENLERGEVFLFWDATDLRTATTRHYTNGVYQGTEYRFDWIDAA